MAGISLSSPQCASTRSSRGMAPDALELARRNGDLELDVGRRVLGQGFDPGRAGPASTWPTLPAARTAQAR